MSVITLDQIEAFATFNSISLTDGTQLPGVIGSLQAWETGKGEMPADLVSNPVFATLVSAYNAAADLVSNPGVVGGAGEPVVSAPAVEPVVASEPAPEAPVTGEAATLAPKT